MDQTAKSGVKQATIEAVVIRADGTREDLGVVSYWHANPLKRLLHRLRGQGTTNVRKDT
jgi:hypothetical protein